MSNGAGDRIDINSYGKVLQTLGRFYILPRLQFIYTERNEPQLLFLGSPLRTFCTSTTLTKSGNADHVQQCFRGSSTEHITVSSLKTLALHMASPLWERCFILFDACQSYNSYALMLGASTSGSHWGPTFWRILALAKPSAGCGCVGISASFHHLPLVSLFLFSTPSHTLH